MSVQNYTYFWSQSIDTLEHLADMLTHAGLEEKAIGEQYVKCFPVDDIDPYIQPLEDQLSPDMLREIKVLSSENETLELAEFKHIQTLENLILRLSIKWLSNLVVEGRYKSVMQPIVYARHPHEIKGYEFLLRGYDEDGAEVTPDVMFDKAHDADVSFMLDLAAGESAARAAMEFDIQQDVFINVLPDTISSSEGLKSWVKAVLDCSGLPPERVVFEIVESQRLAEQEMLETAIRTLHGEGIRLALDDFGTGFNNFVSLTNVRPDFIKLDKSLVQNLRHDARKWNLVANIVDAAKQSDIKVIAEGVEDKHTAITLESCGVDFLQGYLFGYPSERPVEEDEESLTSS